MPEIPIYRAIWNSTSMSERVGIKIVVIKAPDILQHSPLSIRYTQLDWPISIGSLNSYVWKPHLKNDKSVIIRRLPFHILLPTGWQQLLFRFQYVLRNDVLHKSLFSSRVCWDILFWRSPRGTRQFNIDPLWKSTSKTVTSFLKRYIRNENHSYALFNNSIFFPYVKNIHLDSPSFRHRMGRDN